MSTVSDISKFFWLKQYIEDKGFNVGHSLFSFGHILWLLCITIGIIFLIKFYNTLSNKEKIQVKKLLAFAIFVLEYVKMLIVGFLFPTYINMYLPLHLCSFAGLAIILEAWFGRNKLIDQMWIFVFLPAALLGILSPSVSIPFFNFFSIHTYLYHGILVLFAILKISCEKVKVTYKGLLKSSFILLCMGIPVYFLNEIFGTNYFIMSEPSDFPAAKVFWNAVVPVFGEVGYAVCMFIFAFFVFNIIYILIISFRHLKKKK